MISVYLLLDSKLAKNRQLPHLVSHGSAVVGFSTAMIAVVSSRHHRLGTPAPVSTADKPVTPPTGRMS